MTDLLMEPICPNEWDPPIPPLPGNEEEQAASSMEVIEEDEEEKSSAAEAAPESTLETLWSRSRPGTPRYVPHGRPHHSLEEPPYIDRQPGPYPDGITGILQPSLRACTREPLVPHEFLNTAYWSNAPRKVGIIFLFSVRFRASHLSKALRATFASTLARDRSGEDKDWRPKVLASPWQ